MLIPVALLGARVIHPSAWKGYSRNFAQTESRTREALVEAMGKALGAVSARDARGFFEHSGYRVMGQPF